MDDLLVYHYEPEKYLLVVNASNIEKDWNWCVSHNTEGAELENASEHMAQLAVQGPKAIQALQKLTSINLSDLPYYTFTHGEFAGEKDVIISNTGYTGAGGFELYFYPEAAMKIWDAVFEAGAEFGIKPVGLGARDTLRLEMGFCLYGNDLDDTTSPIEAGLGWITKFVEGKNFTNRPMLEKQKAEGTTRKLVGFEMIDRGIPVMVTSCIVQTVLPSVWLPPELCRLPARLVSEWGISDPSTAKSVRKSALTCGDVS